MHKNEDESRPSSRRNSTSASRRNSVTDTKTNSPSSANSTPKKVQRSNFDFVVTGKQILKKSDRASSLPAAHHRRQSVDSISMLKSRRILDSPKRLASQASKSRDASLEDDLSLDLSQVSDFEDTNSKYGINKPIATSTPKKTHKRLIHSVLTDKHNKSLESRCSKESSSLSKDSYKSSIASPYSHAMSTELECSSGSPTSAPSSGDSGQGFAPDTMMSSRSQDLQDSCCVSTWQESAKQEVGEWGHFWANYNSSLTHVPVTRYYDQCPTPYRTEDIELGDFGFINEGVQRSPDNINNINNIIRNEGLHLTPRETQNIIKCAHILGNVLTKAIERQSKETQYEKQVEVVNVESVDPEKELKKKSLSLNLKETVLPLEVKEEKRWESVPTQTDISLPNTKSAPRIFEKILRQLSKSSLDDVKKIDENIEESAQEKDNTLNEANAAD